MASERLSELLGQRLEQLRAADLLRDPHSPLRTLAEASAGTLGRPLIDLSSNDYLGLAHLRTQVEEPGGAGASRLIHGTHAVHRRLEASLAQWLGTESALLFASGYAANVGLISALAEPQDLVISDALNHASLIDGSRLSKAEVKVIPHRDLNALAQALRMAAGRTVWVVSEAYFSMDGTVCDVSAVADLLERHPNAHLVLDEAHSLGVFGPRGRGLAAAVGYAPAARVGTFGKAFGLHGAFVAGSNALCTWLWNRARSFVFSTATSPAMAETAHQRLAQVIAADSARQHLRSLCDTLHVQLNRHYPERCVAGSVGPITPFVIGDARAAVASAEALARRGILTQAVRPPTVPSGTSRLRLSLGAHLKHAELEVALDTLREVLATRAMSHRTPTRTSSHK